LPTRTLVKPAPRKQLPPPRVLHRGTGLIVQVEIRAKCQQGIRHIGVDPGEPGDRPHLFSIHVPGNQQGTGDHQGDFWSICVPCSSLSKVLQRALVGNSRQCQMDPLIIGFEVELNTTAALESVP
jgi:hypothetical protein